MTEVWKEIMRENVESYKAIQILKNNSILDEEEVAVHEHNLLFSIIETFESELEE